MKKLNAIMQVSCQACGACFLASKGQVTREDDNYAYVQCPNCGHVHAILKEDA